MAQLTAAIAQRKGDATALVDEFGEDTAVHLVRTLARVAELPVPGR